MPVLQKPALLPIITGLMLLALASPASGTTLRIASHISFVRPIQLAKNADIAFGQVQARPGDRITLGASGAMGIEGTGDVLEPYGRPGVITIGDSRDQVVNVLPANYRPGPGLSALRARCSFKGAETGDCDNALIYGKTGTTLFIGMDITVADALPSADAASSDKAASFDMSIVYQ